MTVTITLARPRSDSVLVTLGGEVDLAALDRLTAVLARAAGCADVVVDASAVDFIDCCALHPLLAAARAAHAAGGRLRLHDPSPAVVTLVSWCGLEEHLPTARAPPDLVHRDRDGSRVVLTHRRLCLEPGVVLHLAQGGRAGGRTVLVLHGEDGPAPVTGTVAHLCVEHRVIAPVHPGGPAPSGRRA